MSTLISTADGNLTGASTFAAAEVGAGALALVRSGSFTTIGTAASLTSPAFTVTAGKVIDGLLLWLWQGTSSPPGTGTFKVDLQKGGVSQASVTVGKADLPDATVGTYQPCFFKFTGTATGDGAANWTIVLTTTSGTSSGQPIIRNNSATSNDWTRALRTTTTQAPVAADDLYVVGDLTGTGTHNVRTVTMDSTAATAYGNGVVNSTSVNGGGLRASMWGKLTYGVAASTNYLLRLNGDLEVYQNGTLTIGATGAEIPRTSTAVLEFQMASASGDFGLQGHIGATINIAGLSRTSGKNVSKCKLTSDASVTIVSGGNAAANGTYGASNAPDAGGSILASSFSDNVTNTSHNINVTTGGQVTNVTQVVSGFVARGSGTNNRYIRVYLGNASSYSAVTNGCFADIDLQAGTIGSATAVGVGTATAATLVAVGLGYVFRLTGKIANVANNCWAGIAACNAAGVTSYAGDATQNFIFDHLSIQTTGSISDTTYNVDTDTGWLNGDYVCIASTTRTAPHCEGSILNANAGASSFVSSITPFGPNYDTSLAAVSHSGTSPTQAEIGLLTRNVKIRSTSTTLWGYIYFEALATVNASWSEFYYLGQTASNKHGVEIDVGATANAKSITFCSIHDTAYGLWCKNNSTSLNLTFSNNVVWNTVNTAVEILNAITNTDWTMDNNLVMKPISGHCFEMGDVGGTFTNNTGVAAGASSFGCDLNESSSIATPLGAFSGNTFHSGQNAGLHLVGAVFSGLISNLKCWRNNSPGIHYSTANATADLTFDTITLFGNSGASVGGNFYLNSTAMDIVNVTGNSIIAGDSSFSCNTGIFVGENVQLNLNGVDMSGTTSIFVPHAQQDFNWNNTIPGGYTIQGTCNNCKFGAPLLFANRQAWTGKSYLGFERYNQVAGDHRTEMTFGQLKTDSITYNTAAPSMRVLPNNASNKLESAPKGKGILVACANGAAVNIAAYVRKSNGIEQGTATIWNSSDKTSGITVSGANLVATNGGGAGVDQGIRGNAGFTSGKLYVEFTCGATFNGASTGVGIALSTATLAGIGNTAVNGCMCVVGGNVYFNGLLQLGGGSIGGVTNGSVVCMAVDLENKRIWFRLAGGNWNNNAGFNPATNTGGIDISSIFPGSGAYPVFSANNTNCSVTMNIGASAYSFTNPWVYIGNQPRLIQRANPALGQNYDAVLATYSAGTGSWNQLSGTSSVATDDGCWEFIMDCDGIGGWINVDDWSTS